MKRLTYLFDKDIHFEYVTREELPNKFGKTDAILYEGVEHLGKKTSVFAYLGMPSGTMPKGGFPAVVLVHGGGGCAFYEWVEYWNGKGYIAIAFDTGGRQFGSREHDGKGTAEQNPRGRYITPDDNGSFGNDKESLTDSWTYYNVASIISAHNILRKNEFVNNERIVLTGISWGGVLTAITSGIDTRFAAFAPVYGTGYLLKSQVFTKEKVPVPEDFNAWSEIFDPTVYITNNEKPMLFTLGMDDAAFSPKNAQLTYGNTSGKILYSYRKNLPHYHRWQDNEQMIHISRFMDTVCKGTSLPFEITEEKRKGETFEVKVNNENAVKRAFYNYTFSSDKDCMLWKWERKEIDISNGIVEIKILPETKYCFIEFSDCEADEFILSSSLQII